MVVDTSTVKMYYIDTLKKNYYLYLPATALLHGKHNIWKLKRVLKHQPLSITPVSTWSHTIV